MFPSDNPSVTSVLSQAFCVMAKKTKTFQEITKKY